MRRAQCRHDAKTRAGLPQGRTKACSRNGSNWYKRSVWWYNVQVSVCKKCAKAMRAAHEKIHPAGRLGRAGYIAGVSDKLWHRQTGQENKYKDEYARLRPARGRRRAKPKPDMNARWSILLFGIGVLVFALIVVPGASVWNWAHEHPVRRVRRGQLCAGAHAFSTLPYGGL